MKPIKNKIIFADARDNQSREFLLRSRYWPCLMIIFYLIACNKLVEIPPPSTTITTSQVFADSIDAAAAISGIYSRIQYDGNGLAFCNGIETVICGLSSDELVSFYTDSYLNFYANTLNPSEGNLYFFFWQQPYQCIYQANTCIEGLQTASSIPQPVKNQFTGEAKFFRSLFYFYLVNLFGDIPYVSSSNWRQTDTMGRTNSSVIYQKIIDDLKDAQSLLGEDYSFSNGQRTRINRHAAAALLARVYLFIGDWRNAEMQASSVINNTQFSLESDLNSVFLANNRESILQWELNTSYGFYNSTAVGYNILPPDVSLPPGYYASAQLLSSFENGDNRRIHWFNENTYEGTTYTYPYKYKVGQHEQVPNGSASEYFTVLRLAEQYLIRAEARAQQGNVAEAAADLNIIRNRAGLSNTGATTQAELMSAILHERQVELFAEWGHRWLDLKRTGKVNDVMSIATPLKNTGTTWQPYQQLYPIPSSQLAINPFLRQNAGYQ